MANHLNTTRLFAGHDRGVYALPEQVIAARDGWTRLGEASIALQPPESPEQVHAQVAAAMVAAATAGQPLPGVDAVLKAQTAQTRYREQVAAVLDAHNRAWSELAAVITDLGPAIITDVLQPVHDKAVTELADIAPLVAGLVTAADVATAPDKARKAWLRVEEVIARYTDARAARADLTMFGVTPTRDTDGVFAGIKNLDVVWPLFRSYHLGGRREAPWHDMALRDALLWQIANGAVLWLPTPAEQDARWQEVTGVDVDQANQRNREMGSFRAIA